MKWKYDVVLGSFPAYNLIHWRGITKVRLKWVKNRSLDHIIEVQTDIKAASLIKNAIIRSPTGYLTSQSLLNSHKMLGLTIPTLRFMRRYPTLFQEYPHPKYPSLLCFKLTELGTMMHNKELELLRNCEPHTVETLCRLLMMTRSRMLPLQSLHPLKWDLGLPDDFDKSFVKRYPDHFRLVKGINGTCCLKLVKWREEFSVPLLQRQNGESAEIETELKRGKSAALEFHMRFPRGYGARKVVKAWMDDFHNLPYISPYEDSSGLDPKSDLMEKRVVGLLHEFLGLTIYKKTKRCYLRCLREELNLPHRFTRIFTRYPGIFYLSLKCKTTTVALREGYQRGKLVDPHPLARHRDKLYYVMRTGLVYRNRALDVLPPLHNAVDVDEDNDEDEDEDYNDEDEEIEVNGEDFDSEGSDED